MQRRDLTPACPDCMSAIEAVETRVFPEGVAYVAKGSRFTLGSEWNNVHVVGMSKVRRQ
jgi:hypothetical protein